jgi:hypothetical protein
LRYIKTAGVSVVSTTQIVLKQTFPGSQTCEECFDSLTSQQKADFEQALSESLGATFMIEDLCAQFDRFSPELQRDLLDLTVDELSEVEGVGQGTINEIEKCIEDFFGIPPATTG